MKDTLSKNVLKSMYIFLLTSIIHPVMKFGYLTLYLDMKPYLPQMHQSLPEILLDTRLHLLSLEAVDKHDRRGDFPTHRGGGEFVQGQTAGELGTRFH